MSFSDLVLISTYTPVTPCFRWILKPVSFPELSVQARTTLLDVTEVIVSPDGALGVLERVVAFFSGVYPEVAKIGRASCREWDLVALVRLVALYAVTFGQTVAMSVECNWSTGLCSIL